MIGATIGIGPDWYKVARNAADRMEAMTGLQCIVITGTGDPQPADPWRVVHPSWLKCKVAEILKHENEFLVFDADVIAHRPWNPKELFKNMRRAFCVVPDTRDQQVFDECNAIGMPFPDVYVNGGLLIFGREHQPIWDAVWKRHPGPFGKWLEQGALNIALLDSGCEVCRLPRYYNTLLHMSQLDGQTVDISRAINLHFCGVNNPQSLLKIQAKLNANHIDKAGQDSLGGVTAEECSLR